MIYPKHGSQVSLVYLERKIEEQLVAGLQKEEGDQ
jgi:hypothetical protein